MFQIWKVLAHLPQLDVRLSISGVWAGEHDGKRISKRVDVIEDGPSHLRNWIQVHADQEYVLQIDGNRFQIDKRVSFLMFLIGDFHSQ